MKPIAVLISGQGTNLHHIAQWCQSGKIDARIVGVISDKKNAPGLEWARKNEFKTACIEYLNSEKDWGEAKINQQLREWGAEFVVLAGFMRILQESFVASWPNALINLHPSLLPLYKGLRPHERILQDGQTEHGCSVHIVIEEWDAGPVIAQGKIKVNKKDDSETLAARVRALEHQLLPRVIQMICSGVIDLHDGTAYYEEREIITPLMLDEILQKEKELEHQPSMLDEILQKELEHQPSTLNESLQKELEHQPSTLNESLQKELVSRLLPKVVQIVCSEVIDLRDRTARYEGLMNKELEPRLLQLEHQPSMLNEIFQKRIGAPTVAQGYADDLLRGD